MNPSDQTKVHEHRRRIDMNDYERHGYSSHSGDGRRRPPANRHNKKKGTFNLGRFLRKLWRENKFEVIAVSVLVVAFAVALPFLIKSVKSVSPKEELPSAADVNLEDYGDLFSDKVNQDSSGSSSKSSSSSSNGVRVRVDEDTGKEVEDPTVLAEQKGTKSGYLDNCVFIGDSRTVAMVSYGVVSDEDVLAKVGISHTSVKNYTFTQNSGKQYTVKSFLAAKTEPVIYIALGVNGMKGAKEEEYEKSFKDLVEYIMELAPDRKIVLVSIWPVDDNGTYKGSVKNEWIDKYNDFLLALADYEDIYYLAINNVLKDKNGSIKKEYDGGDGLHYSASAYNVIIDYIISHPVPGISDDGDYVVHYVKPRGEYKDMIKKGDPVVTPIPTVAHEHSYFVSEITKEATCTEPGIQIMACEGCDSTYEQEIPPLGHKYGDDGICVRCGAKNPDYVPSEKQQHVHKYVDNLKWEGRKEPTCETEGVRQMLCECGDHYEEKIPALGHDYGEDGKCKRCGAKNPDYVEPVKEPAAEPTPTPTPDPPTEPAPEPTQEPATQPSEGENSSGGESQEAMQSGGGDVQTTE